MCDNCHHIILIFCFNAIHKCEGQTKKNKITVIHVQDTGTGKLCMQQIVHNFKSKKQIFSVY